jgi:hypothetical protein
MGIRLLRFEYDGQVRWGVYEDALRLVEGRLTKYFNRWTFTNCKS